LLSLKGETKAERDTLEKVHTFDFKITIPAVTAHLSRPKEMALHLAAAQQTSKR